MKYIYLDIEKAKIGTALVYEVREFRRENYESYFEGKAVEFQGEDLPHFITYIQETDSIRQATEEEKLERGQRRLNSNEILLNGEIISYDPGTQKVIDGLLIEKTREDYITEGIVNLDSEKAKARLQRDKDFEALDLYDKAVLRGDIEEASDMKSERDEFRSKWLILPNSYTDISEEIESLYPQMPEFIKYFV
jgi:acyl carrier protein phosphodiesterase